MSKIERQSESEGRGVTDGIDIQLQRSRSSPRKYYPYQR